MRDTHVIAIDIHRRIETLNLNLTLNLREGLWRNRIWKITLEIDCSGCACNQSQDQYANK